MPVGLRWVLHGCLIGRVIVVRVCSAAASSHFDCWASRGGMLAGRELFSVVLMVRSNSMDAIGRQDDPFGVQQYPSYATADRLKNGKNVS